MSDVAVPARLSTGLPSPQFTPIPLTVDELVTVNATLTVAPVVTGLGNGLLTDTVGGVKGFWTAIDVVAWLVEPLLSVALTATEKVPADAYVCESEVAMPSRLSEFPSPQLTV